MTFGEEIAYVVICVITVGGIIGSLVKLYNDIKNA